VREDAFWFADVQWEKEPVDQLARLHALLANDRASAIKGFETLADQGSLAAALYAAMELDRVPSGSEDTQAALRWYGVAAKRGSRAAGYQLGILRTNLNDLLGAEEAFKLGDSRDFAPSIYRLACLYRYDGRRCFASKEPATIRDLLERSSRLNHLFSVRDLGTLYLTGKLWKRRPWRGIFLICKMFLLIPKAVLEMLRGSLKVDEMLRG
jgi:hypothetical protein